MSTRWERGLEKELPHRHYSLADWCDIDDLSNFQYGIDMGMFTVVLEAHPFVVFEHSYSPTRGEGPIIHSSRSSDSPYTPSGKATLAVPNNCHNQESRMDPNRFGGESWGVRWCGSPQLRGLFRWHPGEDPRQRRYLPTYQEGNPLDKKDQNKLIERFFECQLNLQWLVEFLVHSPDAKHHVLKEDEEGNKFTKHWFRVAEKEDEMIETSAFSRCSAVGRAMAVIGGALWECTHDWDNMSNQERDRLYLKTPGAKLTRKHLSYSMEKEESNFHEFCQENNGRFGWARATATLYCETGDFDYSSLMAEEHIPEETEQDKKLNLKESVFVMVHPIIRHQEVIEVAGSGFKEYGEPGEIDQVTHLVFRFDY